MRRRSPWVLAGAMLFAIVGGLLLVRRGGSSGAPSESVRAAAAESPPLESPPAPPAPSPIRTEAATASAPDLPTSREAGELAASAATVERGTLRVRVLDAWDRPVGKARVAAIRSGEDDELASDLSKEDGIAELRVPRGETFRLVVEDLWRPCNKPFVGEGVSAEWGFVDARLGTHYARVTGRVVAAETGKTLPDAELMSVVSTEEVHYAGGGGLEQGGAFDVTVPAGELDLAAAAPGRSPATRSLLLAPGDWVRDVVLALPVLGGVALSGRVLDGTGTPVRGAKIVLFFLQELRLAGASSGSWIQVGELESAADGTFEFEETVAGKNSVSVRADGFEPTGAIRMKVGEEGGTVEVVLARAGRLRVRALGPDGAPVPDAAVSLKRDEEIVIQRTQVSDDWRLLRARRHFRFHGAPQDSSGDSGGGDWGFAPPPDEEGFATIDGVPTGIWDLSVENETLVGETPVFVAADETAVVEVRLRDRRP